VRRFSDRVKHPGSNGNWHNDVAALQSSGKQALIEQRGS